MSKKILRSRIKTVRNLHDVSLLWLMSSFAQMYGVTQAFGANSKGNIIAVVILSVFQFIAINVTTVKAILLHRTRKQTTSQAFSVFKIIIAGLSNILIFATLYYVFGVIDTSLASTAAAIKGDFITSLYFSIITWTTVGYGDFKPVPELRLVAGFEALLGTFYIAILVGVLNDLMTGPDSSKTI